MSHVPGKSRSASQVAPVVSEALRELNSRWRGSDIPLAERRALPKDVRADLVAAHAATGGSSVHELLGTDAATFANDVVRERGALRPGGRYAAMVACAVLGVFLGVIGVWPVFQAAVDAVMSVPPEMAAGDPGVSTDAQGNITYPAQQQSTGQLIVIFGGYTLGGLVVAALMVGGVYFSLRHRARAGATARRSAVLIPVSVAVTLPAAILFARLTGYSGALGVIFLECGLVVGGAVLAVVVSRWWALRTLPTAADEDGGSSSPQDAMEARATGSRRFWTSSIIVLIVLGSITFVVPPVYFLAFSVVFVVSASAIAVIGWRLGRHEALR